MFMPPGSARSTYGSILFPPYVMANAPNRAILAASHTIELAERAIQLPQKRVQPKTC